MGGIGWHNACPFELGGGPTEEENVYEAMRRAVGEGGSAVSDAGIDGLWRQARASAIAALGTCAERAALQALPDRATDHLGEYEGLLGLVPAGAERERRDAVVAEYARRLYADLPHLSAELQKLDARLRIEMLDPSRAFAIVPGRAFGPRGAGSEDAPPYGPTSATAWPMYATAFHLRVLFAVGSAPLSPADRASVARAKSILRDVLPAWMDFSVRTKVGFTLDRDRLDLTGMQ